MQFSHRNKSDAVIPVPWSQEEGGREQGREDWQGMSAVGSQAVSAGFQAMKRSMLGLNYPLTSPTLGEVRTVGVYVLYL